MFNTEAKKLEQTLSELEVKLGLHLKENKVSIHSANSMSDLISEAKSRIKTAAQDLNDLLHVKQTIQKVKCLIG